MRILLKQNEASFKQLFNDYLTSCKARGLADTTIASYKSHMHSIGNYLNLDTPDTVLPRPSARLLMHLP